MALRSEDLRVTDRQGLRAGPGSTAGLADGVLCGGGLGGAVVVCWRLTVTTWLASAVLCGGGLGGGSGGIVGICCCSFNCKPALLILVSLCVLKRFVEVFVV